MLMTVKAMRMTVRAIFITPVYGRFREAVIGPAFYAGLGGAELFIPPHAALSAAFTRLLLFTAR
jgi:hypothetical protein